MSEFLVPMATNRPRGTSKKRVSRKANAVDSLEGFGKNVECDIITFGQFSLIDAIDAVLDYTGPADVILATWAAAEFDMSQMQKQLTDKRIISLRMIIDRSMVSRHPNFCAALEERFGKETLRTTRTHMKFALISSPGWSVVIRTSMNLNFNPRLEYLQVADDEKLHRFFLAVCNAVFAEEDPGLDNQRNLPEMRAVPTVEPSIPVKMGKIPKTGQDPRSGTRRSKGLGTLCQLPKKR